MNIKNLFNNKLDILGIFVVGFSLFQLLTHSYSRILTLFWIILGVFYIKKNGYKKNGFEVPLLIYIFCLSLSLTNALNIKYSYREIYRHLFGFTAPFMVSQYSISREVKYKILDWIIRGLSLYYFIYVIFQSIGILNTTYDFRHIPLNLNPVEYSYIAGFMTIYLWCKFIFQENNKKENILNLIFFLLISYTILVSKTRGAWLGIIATCSFLYLLKSKDILKNFLQITSFYSIFMGLFISFRKVPLVAVYYNKFISIFNTKTDHSNTSRLISWKMAWDRFLENPITGFGYKPKLSYSVGPKGGGQVLEHPHNEYLAYLVGTGVIGLFGYLYLMIFTLFKGVKKEKDILWLTTIGLVMFTIMYGAVELLMHITNSLFLFLFILSLAIGEE